MPEGKSPARDDSLEGLVGALRKAASEVNALPTTAVAAKGSVSAAAGMRALIDLKRVGRDQHLALAEHKEATGEIKGKLARAHLYLQSLQYQKSYYHKEIASCREFVSAFSDAQIGLSDEPAAAVGGRATGVTPHAIMLKRLAHENQERKRLCEAQETLRTREKVGSDRPPENASVLTSSIDAGCPGPSIYPLRVRNGLADVGGHRSWRSTCPANASSC
jgi:hypothetical protein